MKALFTLALLFIACLSYSQQQLLDSVEYIYWGDYTDGTIRKAKLDGSDIDTIVDDDSKIRRIRLDRRDRKIYWASGYYGAIRSANYDGSDISTVLQTSLDIDLIEVDQKNKKIYFTEDYTGTIKRCNTDGTELETIITGTGLVLGMAIDTVRDILFYGDYTNKKIFRAKPDGNDITEIFSTDKQIFDLYIDIKQMYIYFNNRTTNAIHRIFYDGSGFTDIIQVCTNNCVISSLAVSVEYNFLFWVERENDRIARATTNGEDRINIIHIPGSNFSGMDIGKEYLTPVKIDENKLEQIKIYPNPCSSQFFVDAEINSEVSIYNLSGQKLKTSKLTNYNSIDVGELPAGIYFVEVKNENDVFKQKIQVAK